ncbi:MAG: DUF2851 family protein [Chloroflexota bacterium]
MSTRKRITAETQIEEAWCSLVGATLVRSDGVRFELLYAGRPNRSRGPDMKGAVVRIGSTYACGDVELHRCEAEWYSHGHSRDAEYNDVMLHVLDTGGEGSQTRTKAGAVVPVVGLASGVQARMAWLPCQRVREEHEAGALVRLVEGAGKARFELKAGVLQQEMDRSGAEQTFWRALCRAMGYSRNTGPFEALATRLPLARLRLLALVEGTQAVQAWLLGAAGLLPSQRDGARPDSCSEGLEKSWQDVPCGVQPLQSPAWSLAHIYPNNSPVRRLIGLSYLVERYREQRMNDVLSLPLTAEALCAGIEVSGDGYWQTHSDFGVRAARCAVVGQAKAREIVVNVILPFARARGDITGQRDLAGHATDMYMGFPGSKDNAITLHMKRQLGLPDAAHLTACQQQGLIHIYRKYCCAGGCAQCSVAAM